MSINQRASVPTTTTSQEAATTPRKFSSSHGKLRFFTKSTSGPAGKSRGNSKYAKKARSGSKPSIATFRPPQREYVSACCSVPSRKPATGRKESVQDPESHRSKEVPKGLGHWRCGACGKPTKVTPRKPEPKQEVAVA